MPVAVKISSAVSSVTFIFFETAANVGQYQLRVPPLKLIPLRHSPKLTVPVPGCVENSAAGAGFILRVSCRRFKYLVTN